MTTSAGANPLEVALEILEGGVLTTVQDAGRPDWTHLGVPESGAADAWSLTVANLLAGNEPGAAALELTLAGPTLAIHHPIRIGLAGADLGARIRGGRRLLPGRSHHLRAGDLVEFIADPAADRDLGLRVYLAVRGGIDVPIVLGSRSTCLAGGFGGFAGRALRAGDRLGSGNHASGDHASGRPAQGTGGPASAELVWPAADRPVRSGSPGPRPSVLRVLAGPASGLDALAAAAWRVAAAADRVGVRLEGASLPPGIGGETTTQGVSWGAIQVPPDGRPIVLGADHQVTGGYRVVGVVISADLPILGQLRPGAAVRLVEVDRVTAVAALREQRAAFLAAAAALVEAAGWDALVDSAGG